MRHFGRFNHAVEGSSPDWMLPLLLVAGLALVAVVVWLLTRAHRNGSLTAQATPLTREELECQIMAMLAQAGRPLKQAEIADNLALPREEIARVISDLERDGGVVRRWDLAGYTFTVSQVTGPEAPS
jgi:uncharacterized membrane protein